MLNLLVFLFLYLTWSLTHSRNSNNRLGMGREEADTINKTNSEGFSLFFCFGG